MSLHSVKAVCPGLKSTNMQLSSTPPPGQNNLCMQAPHSPVGQAWHPPLRHRCTSRDKEGGTPNVCSQWRDGRKMEDRSFKAYLMYNPQHIAEGGGGRWVHPSICLGLCVFVPVQYVSLPLCLQGRCPTSSVWDEAVCRVSHLLCVTCRLPLSRGTMMHLSSSSATNSQLVPR